MSKGEHLITSRGYRDIQTKENEPWRYGTGNAKEFYRRQDDTKGSVHCSECQNARRHANHQRRRRRRRRPSRHY